MRDSLTALCAGFIQNRDIIKKTFAWDSALIHPVAATVFIDKGMSADPLQLEYCRNLLKEKTGIFSNFRSHIKIPMIAMMATSAAPEQKLQDTLLIYEKLRLHFSSSAYLPLAAMTISNFVPPESYDEMAARTRRIYDLMKKDHPFLTSGEDSAFAALLALSNKSDDQLMHDAQYCYHMLKPHFSSGNAVQSLSHVLVLGSDFAEENCSQTLQLADKLKYRGYKYGTGHELATLGVAAMLPAALDNIADDIVQVADFLSQQKGYCIFGATKTQRLMHAAMITSSDYLGTNESMQAASVSSTISVIIAQQTAMCAAIAATTAATAANAANS